MDYKKVNTKAPEVRMKSPPFSFLAEGPMALFTMPMSKLNGERYTYSIPTYGALKGLVSNIYWKPTIMWVIDAVRVMNPIEYETFSVLDRYDGRYLDKDGQDIHGCVALRDVAYQVKCHFEWNTNQTDMMQDRRWGKHIALVNRSIEIGGRFQTFLGTSECPCFITPCKFGEGTSAFDDVPEMDPGYMFHSFIYPNEDLGHRFGNNMAKAFWHPVMKNGVIEFCRPEECSEIEIVRAAEPVIFENKKNNSVKPYSEALKYKENVA